MDQLISSGVDTNGLQGMQKHLKRTAEDIKRELVHVRYGIGKGDFGAAFNACNKAEKHADTLVSANSHTLATLEGVLLAYTNMESWVREFLENLKVIYPDVYELLMSAEITIEDDTK